MKLTKRKTSVTILILDELWHSTYKASQSSVEDSVWTSVHYQVKLLVEAALCNLKT
jgi:hypothetical protein